jgi:hypothetical protein
MFVLLYKLIPLAVLDNRDFVYCLILNKSMINQFYLDYLIEKYLLSVTDFSKMSCKRIDYWSVPECDFFLISGKISSR